MFDSLEESPVRLCLDNFVVECLAFVMIVDIDNDFNIINRIVTQNV